MYFKLRATLVPGTRACYEHGRYEFVKGRIVQQMAGRTKAPHVSLALDEIYRGLDVKPDASIG